MSLLHQRNCGVWTRQNMDLASKITQGTNNQRYFCTWRLEGFVLVKGKDILWTYKGMGPRYEILYNRYYRSYIGTRFNNITSVLWLQQLYPPEWFWLSNFNSNTKTFDRYTLQGTNISPKNGILKMIFLFPRWDMLIPWRVRAPTTILHHSYGTSKTDLTLPEISAGIAVDTLECALVFTGTNHFAELGSSVKHPGVFANFRSGRDGLHHGFWFQWFQG